MSLKRINYLDGWRGLAILLVLASHFFYIKTFDFGRLGVDVFFVLSGLLMSNILFVKKTPLKIFYKRRISRIIPVFFIYVTLIYSICYLLKLSQEYKNYIYTLSFIRSYVPTNPHIWRTGIPVGHIWSLNIEEHCYLVLGLITLLPFFRNKRYFLIFILGCASILLHLLYYKFPSVASKNYHIKTEIASSHLMISAGYFLIKNKIEKFIPNWLPVLTLALSFLCYYHLVPKWASWVISPFLLSFTVNHLNLLPEFFKQRLENVVLRKFGIWSYSIYLWQQPFGFYLYYNLYEKGKYSIILGCMFLMLSIIVGLFSFYFIENPIRRYLNSNW